MLFQQIDEAEIYSNPACGNPGISQGNVVIGINGYFRILEDNHS
jgi:hypothetical protein